MGADSFSQTAAMASIMARQPSSTGFCECPVLFHCASGCITKSHKTAVSCCPFGKSSCRSCRKSLISSKSRTARSMFGQTSLSPRFVRMVCPGAPVQSSIMVNSSVKGFIPSVYADGSTLNMKSLDRSREHGNLTVGARNTTNKRITAPDMGGFIVSTALCREYAGNKRPVRGIPAGRLVAVFLAPGAFFYPGHRHPRSRKASQQERGPVMVPKILNPTLIAVLRSELARKEISLVTLAERLDMPLPAVTRIFVEVEPLTVDTASQIADVLHRDLAGIIRQTKYAKAHYPNMGEPDPTERSAA